MWCASQPLIFFRIESIALSSVDKPKRQWCLHLLSLVLSGSKFDVLLDTILSR